MLACVEYHPFLGTKEEQRRWPVQPVPAAAGGKAQMQSLQTLTPAGL